MVVLSGFVVAHPNVQLQYCKTQQCAQKQLIRMLLADRRMSMIFFRELTSVQGGRETCFCCWHY
jgi:hypothetical protein